MHRSERPAGVRTDQTGAGQRKNGSRPRLWFMGGGGLLGTLSDVVIVVALVVAVVVGALFVGGRIAPRAGNDDPEVDGEEL